jgi:tight adherence protein B
LKRLEKLFESAGLGHLSAPLLAAGLVVLLLGLALTAVRATGVLGIGVAVLVIASGVVIEGLKVAGLQRFRTVIATLPEAAEAIAAGVASGEQLETAVAALAVAGPKPLRPSFTKFAQLLQSGYSLEQSLDWLQLELSDVYADQLVHLLKISAVSGGTGLVANLNSLAATIREQAALDAEIVAKQGWVIGTAKLGIAAPWFIVLFLNQRPEAHGFYASAQGASLLLVGLVVCVCAYALILRVARLPQPRRVLNVAK